MFDVRPSQEMSFESTLIPHGTLVMCVIEKSEGPQQSRGNPNNYFANWTLRVCEGPYAGSTFFDNVATAGDDRFVTFGRMKMSYALEINRNAHVNGNYQIESQDDLVGMKVLVKAGIDIYRDKNGSYRHRNIALAYGSPRAASRNNQIYSDYLAGLQPYQTDFKPELPQSTAIKGGATGGHPTFDDSIPF